MRYSYEFKRKCVELYCQSVGLQHICLIYLPYLSASFSCYLPHFILKCGR